MGSKLWISIGLSHWNHKRSWALWHQPSIWHSKLDLHSTVAPLDTLKDIQGHDQKPLPASLPAKLEASKTLCFALGAPQNDCPNLVHSALAKERFKCLSAHKYASNATSAQVKQTEMHSLVLCTVSFSNKKQTQSKEHQIFSRC